MTMAGSGWRFRPRDWQDIAGPFVTEANAERIGAGNALPVGQGQDPGLACIHPAAARDLITGVVGFDQDFIGTAESQDLWRLLADVGRCGAAENTALAL